MIEDKRDFILDDSINAPLLPTEENVLKIINVVLKRFPMEKQEETLRGLMKSTALYPQECKEVLIKYKYFDENGNYIYKPQ